MTKGIYLGAPTTCPPFWRTIAAHWVREIRSLRHCHVNRKFAGQMTMAATVHAATVAWRHVSIA